MQLKKSFTLIEILVAMVIVGILASLALPNYRTIKEKSLDKEAKASLALMRAAQKIYKMESPSGIYYGDTSNIFNINTNLRLSLPESSSWGYRAENTGICKALRSGSFMVRTWTLDASAVCENPTCSSSVGGCLSAGGC